MDEKIRDETSCDTVPLNTRDRKSCDTVPLKTRDQTSCDTVPLKPGMEHLATQSL